MKYFLLLLTSGLAITSAAHAQIGVRLGGNLAKFHTTEGQSPSTSSTSGVRAGYQVGITYQLPLTTRLSLVPEVQYSHERLTLTQINFNNYPGFETGTQLRLEYLNVPVLVRATFGRVYIEGGLQASLLLGGDEIGTRFVKGGRGSSPVPYEIKQTVAKTYRRFDGGPCVGLGVKLLAGLGASVRAYQGLQVLNRDNSDYEGSFRRQALQASLTYQLGAR
jgi:hypothetical protein